MHDQDAAGPAARGLQHAIEHVALTFAAEQLLAREPNR
jgi:hypothetical protein